MNFCAEPQTFIKSQHVKCFLLETLVCTVSSASPPQTDDPLLFTLFSQPKTLESVQFVKSGRNQSDLQFPPNEAAVT